jgi:hypothetical protein
MTQNRRKYERHGLARGETLQTFKVCQDINRSPWTRVCPEWRESDAQFTRDVIASIGLRPESDPAGRWLLIPRPDLSYLLDIEASPDPFDLLEELCEGWTLSHAQWRIFERQPLEIKAGHEFKPGHVEWRWMPRRIREPKVKSTKPLPEKFERGDWYRWDDARRKQAKRAARKRHSLGH